MFSIHGNAQRYHRYVIGRACLAVCAMQRIQVVLRRTVAAPQRLELGGRQGVVQAIGGEQVAVARCGLAVSDVQPILRCIVVIQCIVTQDQAVHQSLVDRCVFPHFFF